MPRDDLLYLDDMLEMAETAKRFVAGKTREEFEGDEQLQFALTHALQIIGEAAFKVSKLFRLANPQIPWKQIAGFRHRAVHDYFDVQLEIVWKIATTEIEPLIESLRPLIPPQPPDAEF